MKLLKIINQDRFVIDTDNCLEYFNNYSNNSIYKYQDTELDDNIIREFYCKNTLIESLILCW